MSRFSVVRTPGCYSYDPFGELTSATNGARQSVGYGYDADGNATTITYPLPANATWAQSPTVAYGYDHADLLTSASDFTGHQNSIGYTADSMPNSAFLGTTADTIATSYDKTDNPSAITLASGTSTLQTFSYADAPASTILSECDTAPSCSQPSASYAYDANGRIKSMTAAGGQCRTMESTRQAT